MARLENLLPAGSALVDHFDLIAGTSIGGITALGLAHGKSAKELLEFYLEHGDEIFPETRFPRMRNLSRMFGPPFNRIALDRLLIQEFGTKGFWESKTRLCIPAVETKFGEVYIYKTPHHPDFKMDWSRSVVEVAQATSAAPTIFRAVHQGGYSFVDGGLFANDPSMIAIVDALTCFSVERNKVKVLSLGCLDDKWDLESITRKFAPGSGWLIDAYSITGSLQAQNAQGQAGLLIGPENILRISAPQPERPIELFDYSRAANELPPLATELFETHGATVEDMFFKQPREPFEPIYAPTQPPGGD